VSLAVLGWGGEKKPEAAAAQAEAPSFLDIASGDLRSPGCGQLDAERVYLVGVVPVPSKTDTHGMDAIAELEPGTRWCGVSREAKSMSFAMRGDGVVAYLDDPFSSRNSRVLLLKEVPMYRVGAQWTPLVGPGAGGEIELATPRCPGTAVLIRFLPGEAGYVYRCGNGSAFDNDGVEIRDWGNVRALGYGRHTIRCTQASILGLAVEDERGNLSQLPKTLDRPGDGFQECSKLCAVRAKRDGFLVAFSRENWEKEVDLFHVDFDGTPRKLGRYSKPDGEPVSCRATMDGDGVLYTMWKGDSERGVRRIPLSPKTPSFVYRDHDRAVGVRFGTATDLITGP
jgi:hypothetical protein